MKKQPKQRVIYDNYNIYDNRDSTREILLEEHAPEDIDDEMILKELYFQSETEWENEQYSLIQFFNGASWLMMGSVGGWRGASAAGTVFDDFLKMFYTATKDCSYWRFWDENGHLYFKCSHHDGTNLFEIKKLNQKALDLIEKWEYDYMDKRTEEEIHSLMFNCNLFSSLPHYAHIKYGCPKKEM